MDCDERALSSSDFPVHWPVLTRWADNDMFGHLNNAVYYTLFDTAINAWITTSTGLNPVTAPQLGVVAESGCRYYSELKFLDPLVIGLSVSRLGRTSVTYRLCAFASSVGEADQAQPVAAVGHWVHVYIDRTTRKPVPIPTDIRALLQSTLQNWMRPNKLLCTGFGGVLILAFGPPVAPIGVAGRTLSAAPRWIAFAAQILLGPILQVCNNS